ncbi:MAG: tRNA (N6-isopentenyl adenosine(37)-C2)-methylthiotransferase MiaB [Elusimicrobia bacterium RIFOXYB2_FULL_49_7]|nr:MAG: tRNA (N6-isopentenyl adenosine(37)-C2)-methylthiotransferase MiaB [Elusimicrobia bacterium RIFOXYB2_FULL_49_7]
MNLADSESIAAILSSLGLSATPSPETADIIVVNTCTVRESAVSRVLARISRFKPLKRMRPGLRIAVTGCLAEQEKASLRQKLPFVDYVLGPDQYLQFSELLAFSQNPLACSDGGFYSEVEPVRTAGINAWIPILRGCDNYCSYCIVPYVRGRERSKPAETVLNEVKQAVDAGFSQVTLLGQNVNSYSYCGLDFPGLLRRIDGVAGLKRVRFMTSHPKDLSEDLIRCFGELPTLCEYLHLPVQSGSNTVLARMNRGYTIDHYRRQIDRLRHCVPSIALSTDVLCGFPDETAEEHESTVRLMREVEYDSAFMFIYSERKGTAAARLSDNVPRQEKIARVSEIIRLQTAMTRKKNEVYVGREEEVLVEGEGPREENTVTSRTRTFKNVILEKTNRNFVGALLRVRITGSTGWALQGSVLSGKE